MGRDPRDMVAIILALCILWFYIFGTLAGIALRWMYPGQPIYDDIEVSQLWADITKTIIGGLLVYIAARKRGGPPDDELE